MDVIKVVPRGYCKGVVRAIRMAIQCAQDYPQKRITILGMLVHNQYVIEALKSYHIETIEDSNKTREELLDDISDGVVIFTAHGISDQAKEKARQKGLICVDASCPDVLKTRRIINDRLHQGYEIIYIGKAKHPEAEAICSLSERIHFMSVNDDIPKNLPSLLFVTNQTTMSQYELRSLFERIHTQYPNAQFSEEICPATRVRQTAVAQLKDQNIDCLYVVGDRSSNNSHRLAEIGKAIHIPNVYLIDDVNDMKPEQLNGVQRIAITAGASTPSYLSDQVIEYLENYETKKERPKINIADLLRGII